MREAVVKILNCSENPTPEFKTQGSAGFDLAITSDIEIPPGGCVLVDTGLKIIIPEGYEGQLRLRSSMYNRGVVMPNSPGTIDSDYRGFIKIPLANLSSWSTAKFKKGERIAQMVINKLPQVRIESVSFEDFELECSTGRGDGGFGSTGI